MGFLTELHKKPKVVRDQYALVGAILVVAVVTAIWALSLPAQFGHVTETAPTESSWWSNVSSFLAVTRDQVGNGISALKGGLAPASSTPSAINQNDLNVTIEAAIAENPKPATTTEGSPVPVKPAPRQVLLVATTTSTSSRASSTDQ